MVTRTLNACSGGVEWSRRKLKNFAKDGINNNKSVRSLKGYKCAPVQRCSAITIWPFVSSHAGRQTLLSYTMKYVFSIFFSPSFLPLFCCFLPFFHFFFFYSFVRASSGRFEFKLHNVERNC